MRIQIQVAQSNLEDYKNKLVSFEELAKLCNISRPLLTRYFRENNLLTNRDIKYNSVNHTIFSNIDNELSAYLLGLYVADGSINLYKSKYSECKRFSISLSEKDSRHMSRIKDLLCPNHALSISNSKVNQDGSISKPMYKITITSNIIFDDLVKLGYGERKTYSELSLPKLSDELLWHFIRGYFDGDGTIGTYKGKQYKDKNYPNYQFSFIAKTHTLLTEIQAFFLTCGIVSYLKEDIKKQVWYLSINKKQNIVSIRGLLYKNATWYLQRKHDKFMEIPS